MLYNVLACLIIHCGSEPTQISRTHESSFILPSRLGPSSSHVSTRPSLGSSSGKPLVRRTSNTRSLIFFVTSLRSSTASSPYNNSSFRTPSGRSRAEGELFSTFSLSSFHRLLYPPNTVSVSTLFPNVMLICFPARGRNRGNLRLSCIT